MRWKPWSFTLTVRKIRTGRQMTVRINFTSK